LLEFAAGKANSFRRLLPIAQVCDIDIVFGSQIPIWSVGDRFAPGYPGIEDEFNMARLQA
jgi:hypothetical protein